MAAEQGDDQQRRPSPARRARPPGPRGPRRIWVTAGRLFARWRPRRLLRGLSLKARFRLRVLKWVVLATSPVWALNLTVAFLGHSVVFPLSPFFLREKLSALGSYARHRPVCLFRGHPDTAPLVAAAEVRHRLPRGLLAAVVHVESNGRPHRISAAGAMGPAQLMPDTARRLNVSDPFDSADNIDGAARLLAGHLAHFHSLRLAIAAYHAGPAAVSNGVPQNGITPIYVARVLNAYATLRPRRAAARSPA